MNKTGKRAAQKHRASEQKYALRRKAETGQQAAGGKGKSAQATAARSRTTSKRAATDSSEGDNA